MTFREVIGERRDMNDEPVVAATGYLIGDVEKPPIGPSPFTINTVYGLRNRVWATRDVCVDHYPRYCPPCCSNAGQHDAKLGVLCECHQCRTT